MQRDGYPALQVAPHFKANGATQNTFDLGNQQPWLRSRGWRRPSGSAVLDSVAPKRADLRRSAPAGDPEPPGTMGCLTKPHGKACSHGTVFGAVGLPMSGTRKSPQHKKHAVATCYELGSRVN